MKHHTKYRDLDEVKASPAAERKLPWWIKETDKPTVEIDWDAMERFDCSKIMFLNGFAQAIGPEKAMKAGEKAMETAKKTMSGKKPGFSLKEKALGALRAGIRTIIIPEKNKKELAEIPPQLKRRIKFIPVKHMDEILSHAILQMKQTGQSKRAKVKRK